MLLFCDLHESRFGRCIKVVLCVAQAYETQTEFKWKWAGAGYLFGMKRVLRQSRLIVVTIVAQIYTCFISQAAYHSLLWLVITGVFLFTIVLAVLTLQYLFKDDIRKVSIIMAQYTLIAGISAIIILHF